MNNDGTMRVILWPRISMKDRIFQHNPVLGGFTEIFGEKLKYKTMLTNTQMSLNWGIVNTVLALIRCWSTI
jgi:hypothetical protein